MYSGKDLKSKLNEFFALEEKNVADIIQRLLLGLTHMQEHKVIHRDIKPENIFFRNPNNLGDVCISNFIIAEIS